MIKYVWLYAALLCVFLMAVVQSAAQPDVWEQQIHSATGITQLTAYNALAAQALRTSSGRADFYAEQTLRLAPAYRAGIGDHPGDPDFDLNGLIRCEADAHYLLGQALESRGSYSKAQRQYRESRTQAAAAGYQSRVVMADSAYQRMSQKPTLTRQLIKLAEETMAPIGGERDTTHDKTLSRDIAIVTLEGWAAKAELSRNYPQAIGHYQNLLPLYAASADTVAMRRIHRKLETLYRKTGNAQEADKHALLSRHPTPATVATSPGAPSAEAVIENLRESAAEEVRPSAHELEIASASEAVLRETEALARAGKYEQALITFQRYKTLQQELITLQAERQRDSTLLETNISRIALMEEEQTLQRQRIWVMSIVLVLILGAAVTIGWLFFSIRRTLQQLSVAHAQLEQTHTQLVETQTQLVAAEKMASLGQLTAGIAHEINNPVNFITANIFPLRRNITDLIQLLHAYQQAQSPQQTAAAAALALKLDLPYLQQETQELLNGLQEGADRTAEIVSGLRIFARLDEDDLKTFDLHTGLDATLSLLKNRLTGIEVLRDYADLPLIAGFPGKINQVFMNVLTNAIQAMPQGGIIYLQTQLDGREAVIRIRDTGIGMNEVTRSRAFEPFFTTKDVGEGTGLGLSISLGIVTQHQGSITLQSLEGQGTEVEIRLPVG